MNLMEPPLKTVRFLYKIMSKKFIIGTTDVTPLESYSSLTNVPSSFSPNQLLAISSNPQIYQKTPAGDKLLLKPECSTDKDGYLKKPKVPSDGGNTNVFLFDGTNAVPCFEPVPKDQITGTPSSLFSHLVVRAYCPYGSKNICIIFAEGMLRNAAPSASGWTIIEDLKIYGKSPNCVATGPAWYWPSKQLTGGLAWDRTKLTARLDTYSYTLARNDNFRGYAVAILN